jgi:hypothetical protein
VELSSKPPGLSVTECENQLKICVRLSTLRFFVVGTPETSSIFKIARLLDSSSVVCCIIHRIIFEGTKHEIGDADSSHKKLRFYRNEGMFLATKKRLILSKKKLFRGLVD